jgi:hypothetical protein
MGQKVKNIKEDNGYKKHEMGSTTPDTVYSSLHVQLLSNLQQGSTNFFAFTYPVGQWV